LVLGDAVDSGIDSDEERNDIARWLSLDWRGDDGTIGDRQLGLREGVGDTAGIESRVGRPPPAPVLVRIIPARNRGQSQPVLIITKAACVDPEHFRGIVTGKMF